MIERYELFKNWESVDNGDYKKNRYKNKPGLNRGMPGLHPGIEFYGQLGNDDIIGWGVLSHIKEYEQGYVILFWSSKEVDTPKYSDCSISEFYKMDRKIDRYVSDSYREEYVLYLLEEMEITNFLSSSKIDAFYKPTIHSVIDQFKSYNGKVHFWFPNDGDLVRLKLRFDEEEYKSREWRISALHKRVALSF